MIYEHRWETEKEARAFIAGVNLVGDIDVLTSGPEHSADMSNQGKNWLVKVEVREY
jgi:hypothetical protein